MQIRFILLGLLCLAVMWFAFNLRRVNKGLSWFLFLLSLAFFILMAGGFFGFIRPY